MSCKYDHARFFSAIKIVECGATGLPERFQVKRQQLVALRVLQASAVC